MKGQDDHAADLDLVSAQRPTALVYAVPHAGRTVPVALAGQLQANAETLRSLEDPLVDKLVAGTDRLGAAVLVNRIARAIADVNRDPTELDPRLIDGGIGRETPRTRAGLGVIPRLGGDGKALYRGRLQACEVEARIDAIHRPYHAALAGLMTAAHQRSGHAVLIDWHSMPSVAADAEQKRGGVRPDIVLGDRFGQSAVGGLAGAVRGAFEARGRRVVMNRPFAGGYTTQLWGRPDTGYHALQVEIDRSLYLDEPTLDPTEGFEALKADIAAVTTAVVTWLESKKAAPESAA